MGLFKPGFMENPFIAQKFWGTGSFWDRTNPGKSQYPFTN